MKKQMNNYGSNKQIKMLQYLWRIYDDIYLFVYLFTA